MSVGVMKNRLTIFEDTLCLFYNFYPNLDAIKYKLTIAYTIMFVQKDTYDIFGTHKYPTHNPNKVAIVSNIEFMNELSPQ